MKKSAYKSAMFHVKTSEDFKEATYRKLMLEMEKETPKQKHENHQKERLLQMEKATKRKLTGWAVGIAACAVLAVGIFTMNQDTPTTAPKPSDVVTKPPVMDKVAVNIEGVISEVSTDGKSFKVGGLWVTVTPETGMGIDGPTEAKPSEELLQKEFKVGNFVSGFTTEDIGTGKVNATRIYNNMAPSK
ncbi:hypothetical protein [Paenibacillus sp. GCM10012303]|uniref:hypothetical protein n=1 Tax=Paenibacillus sp. GCM10012303 TaxID=3317340 RepID=UPI0036186164